MSEQEGLTVKKSEDFSEWYTQVINKAELSDIRYNVKGFIVFRPWSVLSMELMYDFLEDELQEKGHSPVWLPAVIPESNFKKESEHIEGFSAEVFWITEAGSDSKKLEEKLALRPTSETAIYSVFPLWIRSWRDLPLKLYQRCQVWRYEGKSTRPFIRSREFHWIESHNAFETKEDAEKQVREDMVITENVLHGKFGIPFLFFERPDHDKFPGAFSTFAADTIMPDGKALQLPSTHLLKQEFPKAFDIKYTDRNGDEKYVWTTCYGPAVSRIYAAVISIHGDDKGLILPPEIAPVQAIIIPIYNEKNREKILKEAEKVKNKLNGIRIRIDDRDEYTPGWKFNEWELKGVPLRIEIGPKDIKNDQVIFVRRDTEKKEKVKQSKLKNEVNTTLDKIQSNLIKRADKFFDENIDDASNIKELKKILDGKGGFVRINWCGDKECSDHIQAKTDGGVIRGKLFGKDENRKGKCVHCQKDTEKIVYISKQY